MRDEGWPAITTAWIEVDVQRTIIDMKATSDGTMGAGLSRMGDT